MARLPRGSNKAYQYLVIAQLKYKYDKSFILDKAAKEVKWLTQQMGRYDWSKGGTVVRSPYTRLGLG
jgi:hypothetical protein